MCSSKESIEIERENLSITTNPETIRNLYDNCDTLYIYPNNTSLLRNGGIKYKPNISLFYYIYYYTDNNLQLTFEYLIKIYNYILYRINDKITEINISIYKLLSINLKIMDNNLFDGEGVGAGVVPKEISIKLNIQYLFNIDKYQYDKIPNIYEILNKMTITDDE